MRHFHRTHVAPADVMTAADDFFSGLGMRTLSSAARLRVYEGVVGEPEVPARVRLSVVPEGGHWTVVEVHTDQMGESRVDRNVKRFFAALHRGGASPAVLEAAY